MGLVRTRLALSNPTHDGLEPIEVDPLVDPGAVHLGLPEHVAIQLRLEELEQREVTLADGSKRLVSYVGPVRTSFRNRSCYTGAMVLGDDVLLDVIPMDDMDLLVRPATRDVVPNPLNPNIPASIAKGERYR
jgi:clan AA aspartic protease